MFGNKLGKIDKMVAKNQAEKLEALLKDKDSTVVLAAVDGLGHCTGDVAFNALVPLVHHPDAQVRAHAITALGADTFNEDMALQYRDQAIAELTEAGATVEVK